ncbi:MAG: cysteine-rich VLP protein [Lachnospiraceae bacterium]|nr:cysteine-rich VLP protein [Lachnospiraceae bacterium]
MINIYKTLLPIRRKANGSLYPITDGQKRSVGKLIRNECCNYVDRNCIALNYDRCPQAISLHIICRWFQDCVLPLDKILESSIYKDRQLIRCVECGSKFVPTSPRSKYCHICSVIVRRKKNAGYKRRSRGSPDDGYVSILNMESIGNSAVSEPTLRDPDISSIQGENLVIKRSRQE